MDRQQISQLPIAHHRYIFGVLTLVALAILAGLAYWFIKTRQVSVSPRTQAEIRADVATILQSQSPVSPEKVQVVSSLLSNSKATASAEERQNIANILNGK
jgi:hypothetical protein